MSGTIFIIGLLVLVAGLCTTSYIETYFVRSASLVALLVTLVLSIFLFGSSFCYWDIRDALNHFENSDIVTLDYSFHNVPTNVISSLKANGYAVIRVEDYHPAGEVSKGVWRFETYIRNAKAPANVRDRYGELSRD